MKRRKDKGSGGGCGGEKLLLYCSRKLSHLVESNGDREQEARNPVPKLYRQLYREQKMERTFDMGRSETLVFRARMTGGGEHGRRMPYYR